MKRFQSFWLDTANECLWHDGAQISLSPKPFAVLRYLVENPGRLVTHDELLDALWPDTFVQPQVLRTYVLELRKVLGDDAGLPRFIQTMPKRGYCFVAPVTDRAGGPHDAAAGTAAKAPAITGREEELARLREFLQPLESGQRQVVFITGEEGIGKTALVDGFSQQVESLSAASVARGQCVQGVGGKEEYYPVLEALAQFCASPDGERVCRTLAQRAPAWLAQGLAPEVATGSNSQPPGQERLVGDLCAALEELAAEKSLILIFEDLHWADDSTLHLLSALARRRGQAKLMILATFVLRKEPAGHSLKVLTQDLSRRRLCARIDLTPLTRRAVTELLRKKLGQEAMPPGVPEFVYEHSEGNPLFVDAILEHLIAQRILVRKGVDGTAHWEQRAPCNEIDAGVPQELVQMIEVEMERLGQEEQNLLEAGSLMSVVFPAWAVAAALGLDPGETEEKCDDLARRLYFVERAGQDELSDGTRSAFYAFAHGLYRKVLYQRQSATRRAKRQILIAKRLGELFAGRESSVAREMAMLYEGAGDWQSAANALRAAALYALERRAFADSAELLEHALCIAGNLGETERGALQGEIRRELTRAREAAIERMEPQEKVPEKFDVFSTEL